MSQIATMLHISDLHFDCNLTEEGRRHWRRNFGVKSHSIGKVAALAGEIFKLRISENGLEDIVLATGDITTDGSPDSFKTSARFFEEYKIFEDYRFVTYGLFTPSNKRIVLPGNHDRYGDGILPYQDKNNRTLEDTFAISNREYPLTLGYRRKENRDDISETALLFFIFDSTLTGELANKTKPWVRIARGIIGTPECQWLETVRYEIEQKKEVMSLDGESIPINYNDAVKIAVLHHHPIQNEEYKTLGTRSHTFLWTLLENSNEFIDACFSAGIDVVLFGHQHQSFITTRSKVIKNSSGTDFQHTILFSCCPSSTEYSDKNNGFNYIEFEKEKLSLRSFVWGGRSFTKGGFHEFFYSRSENRAANA